MMFPCDIGQQYAAKRHKRRGIALAPPGYPFVRLDTHEKCVLCTVCCVGNLRHFEVEGIDSDNFHKSDPLPIT